MSRRERMHALKGSHNSMQPLLAVMLRAIVVVVIVSRAEEGPPDEMGCPLSVVRVCLRNHFRNQSELDYHAALACSSLNYLLIVIVIHPEFLCDNAWLYRGTAFIPQGKSHKLPSYTRSIFLRNCIQGNGRQPSLQ